MAREGKRLQGLKGGVERTRDYPLEEALELIKQSASAKFDESVDVAVNLGVNARKSDQNVRGSTVMPRGTGKQVRVAVFAEGAAAEAARAAGADVVGLEELAEQVRAGQIDFDMAIATPESMRVVGKLGQILGPRGLMPNPKVGTVTFDVGRAVEEQKGGKVEFRVDKAGVVHAPVGKVSFAADRLVENAHALMESIVKAKPSAAKGKYLKSVTLSSTMGPGVDIDTSRVDELVKH